MNRFKFNNWDKTGEFNPKEFYKNRLKKRAIQMKGWINNPNINVDSKVVAKVYGTERQRYSQNLEDFKILKKLNKEVAFLIPTHQGHMLWLKSCLESIKDLNYFMLLAYDTPFFRHKRQNSGFPSPSVLAMADSVIMKHRTYLRSVGVCHYWNMIYGLETLKGLGFRYVFSMNGDCVLEKPEGFDILLEKLGDKDLIPLQYEPQNRYCGTMGWLGKTEIMLDFFYSYLNTLHMFSRTTEGRLHYFVIENGIKVVPVINSNSRFKLPDPDCDWYKILGFRHIHAEHKVRRWEKLEPVERKYYDFGPGEIYLRGEYKLLMDYWKNGNKESLKAWWGK